MIEKVIKGSLICKNRRKCSNFQYVGFAVNCRIKMEKFINIVYS